MTNNLKWKLVVGLLFAFLAGAATGGFVAARQSHHHHHGDRERGPHSLAERMRDRMQERLELSPEQLEKAGPIFEQAAKELEQIRAETGRRVQAVMTEANRALAPNLTDLQRAKLDAFKKSPRGGHRPGKGARRHGSHPGKETAPPPPEPSS